MNDPLLSLALVILVPSVITVALCLAYTAVHALETWRLRRRESRPLAGWRR